MKLDMERLLVKQIEIKQMNCSPDVANCVLDFFARCNTEKTLEQLTIDNLNPSIDSLDNGSILKFTRNCQNIKKLKVKNLFLSSTEARKAMSLLVFQILHQCFDSLEYLSL